MNKGFIAKKIISLIMVLCIGISGLFCFSGCTITKRQYSQDLINAIENNDMEELADLVDKGRDLDSRPLPRVLSDNAVNRPPLVVAVVNANFEAVKILVEAGASVNVTSIDAENSTPLLQAIKGCNNVGSEDYYEIAYYLLEHGADIHANSFLGASALSYFIGNYADSPQGFELFLYLLEHGASIEEGVDGNILFQACASDARLEIVEYIFDNYDVDVNMRSTKAKKGTLLMRTAPYNADPVICQYLLDKGADKTLKNAEGKTAYDIAVESKEFFLTTGYDENDEELKNLNAVIPLLALDSI